MPIRVSPIRVLRMPRYNCNGLLIETSGIIFIPMLPKKARREQIPTVRRRVPTGDLPRRYLERSEVELAS